MTVKFPRRVPLAGTPTPLQFLPRASEAWGGEHRLWIKRDDLTGCILSGNKVRKLEFILAHAQDTGCDTLITCGGIQSNHCRATAFVGAQAGLDVHLVLRGDEPDESDGNYFLDQLAGATITCVPKQDFVRDLPGRLQALAEDYASRGRKALVIPTGGSDGIGAWGYIDGARELARDLQSAAIDRAHVVCASGSGGTQAGLTLGAALYEMPVTVWGVAVCDNEQYFMDKVRQDASDWSRRFPQVPAVDIQPRVIDGYVGDGYGIAGPEVFQLIRELARLEGIVLDPVYTGKAFHGLLQELAAGRFRGCRDIVFVHTGGIFGLLAQRAACI